MTVAPGLGPHHRPEPAKSGGARSLRARPDQSRGCARERAALDDFYPHGPFLALEELKAPHAFNSIMGARHRGGLTYGDGRDLYSPVLRFNPPSHYVVRLRSCKQTNDPRITRKLACRRFQGVLRNGSGKSLPLGVARVAARMSTRSRQHC